MPAVIELAAAQRSFRSASIFINALQPTSLSIRAGEYVTVTGASGSGKSTLLNVMGLLIKPSAGRVIINGTDTQMMSHAEISTLRGATLGFVFQSFHLLPRLTAAENVELPLVYGAITSKQRKRVVLDVLGRVGL